MFTLSPDDKKQLLGDLVDLADLRKSIQIGKVSEEHGKHLILLQDTVVYLRRDLTGLESEVRFLSVGGVLLSIIVILQLIGWL